MLIKLTTRPNKGAPKDVRPVLVGVAQIIAVEPYQPSDPAKGCRVKLAGGGHVEVSESLDDVYDMAQAVLAGPGADDVLAMKRRARGLDRAVTEGVPTDRPDSLQPRPHAAPAYGESHPAAHAAEQFRRETGDPLANEGVPRKEGAPQEGDPLPGHLGRQVTTPGPDAGKLTEAAQQAKGEDSKTDAQKAQEAATSGRPFHPAEAQEGVTRQGEGKPAPAAAPKPAATPPAPAAAPKPAATPPAPPRKHK